LKEEGDWIEDRELPELLGPTAVRDLELG